MKINRKKIDYILTHKFWGSLIFLFLMWLMFFSTFTLGAYPREGILWLLDQLKIYLSAKLSSGYLLDFICNGVIDGVGNVLSFLPNIVILFLFTSIYESTGYMQRAALILDKLMHRIGLHGNAFIPLLMGFGCNVPAIMATKNIPEKDGKILTMLLIPFMSCSARMPVFVLLIGTFFPKYPVLTLFCIYGIGLLVAILTAIILNKLYFYPKHHKESHQHQHPIEEEQQHHNRYHKIIVTPLKRPTPRYVGSLIWDSSYEYLKKIGTIVLFAVMIIWVLDHFPNKDMPHYQSELTQIKRDSTLPDSLKNRQLEELMLDNAAYRQANSYLGQFGTFISPVMTPLGFDWKMSICLVTGLAAKEFIIGTMGVLYRADDSEENSVNLIRRIKDEKYIDGNRAGKPVFNEAVALSFIIFSLLYMPCIATFITIRKMSGTWKWAIFSALYSIGVAWGVAFLVYRMALLFLPVL